MPFFHSTATILPGSKITGTSISNCSIDMNNKNITSVKDPVLIQDAATKNYVDLSVQQFTGCTVSLLGTIWTNVMNLKSGSYLITISSNVQGGPTAIFSVSRANDYITVYGSRISSSPGIDTKETLEISWNAGEPLMMRKTGPGYDGDYIVNMSVKNQSSVASPPVNPSDTATKDYVDQAIENRMNSSFGGTVVELRGMNYSALDNLKPGSYMLSISPNGIDGAPTATFSMSKNSVYSQAAICRITGPSGSNTGEQLDVIWEPGCLPMIRKTGPNYDGSYIVNMNLRNTSSLKEPVVESDVATKWYVDNEIETTMDAKFGGEVVDLEGTDNVVLKSPKYGSYFVTVSPVVPGGPSSAFVIGKTSSETSASASCLFSCPGEGGTKETLELTWPNDSPLMLKKTLPFHDGSYIVDYNLKNIQPDVSTIIPLDVATKEYVDSSLKKFEDLKYGGIAVSLSGDEFSDVIAVKPGCYYAAVSGSCEGAPTACFILCKSLSSSLGKATRLLSTEATVDHIRTTQSLEMDWPSNGKIRLRKTGPLYDGTYVVDFNLKNYEVSNYPVSETDFATKAYVDDSITEKMNEKFGGEVVILTGSSFVEMMSDAANREGSRFISVSSLIPGGPTATFVVSKSSQLNTGSVNRLTSCSGENTGENLEMIWRECKPIEIRKTGNGYDGNYLIDFNLRDFNLDTITTTTLSSPPPWPKDIDVLNKMINDSIDIALKSRFGGTSITLTGTDISLIKRIPPGSYIVSISPSFIGGASGTFSVSKSYDESEPNITCMSHSLGNVYNEKLELLWPPGECLCVKKSRPFHDGCYNVNINAGDFIVQSSSTTTIDVRTMIDDTVEKKLKERVEGIQLILSGTNDTDIGYIDPGAYIVTVSSCNGGPSSVFMIAKTNDDAFPTISELSCCSEKQTKLSLKWNANEPMKLFKSSSYYDGCYNVLMNHYTQTTPPTPTTTTTPTTTPTTTTPTMIITIKEMEPSLIKYLQLGVYMIFVTGETMSAAFMISVNGQKTSVSRMGDVPSDFGTHLNVSWSDTSGGIMLSKTGQDGDGSYDVIIIP